MFGRDKQDDQTYQADDSSQDDRTGAPVFVPEPEHLDTEETSMQDSVNAVMAQEEPAEGQSQPTEENEDNGSDFIMTDAPQTTAEAATQPVEQVAEEEEPEAPAPPDESSTNFAVPVKVNSENGDLNTIKNEALKSLAPLVDHIDQSPEEKFQTVMMMIEATQDSSLVKAAYEAAKAIEDETKRSKALLLVVEKINTLTGKN